MSRGNPYKGFSTSGIHGGAGFCHGQPAHNIALRLAVIPEKVDSEDLAQEVLCRAYTGIGRFRSNTSLWT